MISLSQSERTQVSHGTFYAAANYYWQKNTFEQLLQQLNDPDAHFPGYWKRVILDSLKQLFLMNIFDERVTVKS